MIVNRCDGNFGLEQWAEGSFVRRAKIWDSPQDFKGVAVGIFFEYSKPIQPKPPPLSLECLKSSGPLSAFGRLFEVAVLTHNARYPLVVPAI